LISNQLHAVKLGKWKKSKEAVRAGCSVLNKAY